LADAERQSGCEDADEDRAKPADSREALTDGSEVNFERVSKKLAQSPSR
jgi:hypothetical protein